MDIPSPASLADRKQTIPELGAFVAQARADGMPVRVYVDVSNLWVGGQRTNAVARGLAPSLNATYAIPLLPPWDLDFLALHRLLVPDSDALSCARMYGSFDRGSGCAAERAASASGFDTHFYPRARGKEKRVDVKMALDIAEDIIGQPPTLVVLGSGDADYIPVVELIHRHGGKVVVVGWHGTISSRLTVAADATISLGPWLDPLTYLKAAPAPIGACCQV